jgi:hypothetical protein
MEVTTGRPARKKKAAFKIPDYLVYEIVKGKPIY